MISILKRFIKGFISGGIASVVFALQAGFTITSVSDLKHYGGIVLVAFVTGGLLAIEKAITWNATPQV